MVEIREISSANFFLSPCNQFLQVRSTTCQRKIRKGKEWLEYRFRWRGLLGEQEENWSLSCAGNTPNRRFYERFGHLRLLVKRSERGCGFRCSKISVQQDKTGLGTIKPVRIMWWFSSHYSSLHGISTPMYLD